MIPIHRLREQVEDEMNTLQGDSGICLSDELALGAVERLESIRCNIGTIAEWAPTIAVRLEVIMNSLEEINEREKRFFLNHLAPEDPEFTEEESSPTTNEGGEEIDYGEPLTPPRPTSNKYAFSYDEFTRCLTITVVEDISIRINRV